MLRTVYLHRMPPLQERNLIKRYKGFTICQITNKLMTLGIGALQC